MSYVLDVMNLSSHISIVLIKDPLFRSLSLSKKSPARSKSLPICCIGKSKSTSQLDERRYKEFKNCFHGNKMTEVSSDNGLTLEVPGRRKYRSVQGKTDF